MGNLNMQLQWHKVFCTNKFVAVNKTYNSKLMREHYDTTTTGNVI